MTPDELQVLVNAAQMTGNNPDKLKPSNPWLMSGPVAESMQLAVQALDPTLAARWSSEAGNSASLEAEAAKAGLIPLTNRAAESLASTDAAWLKEVQEQATRREAEQLAELETAADTLAARNANGPSPEQQQHDRMMLADSQRRGQELARAQAGRSF